MTEARETAVPVYSVGDLLRGLRNLLEERVGRVWVVGEISNLHKARSGHCYFSLVDDEGQLRAALFRSAARRLTFEPEDGLEVLVYGDLTVYEPRGDLQLVVRALEPRGRGALQLATEQLRRRLESEGLFDAARKRPLPPLPTRIGVVTSPTGAAIRDVIEVSGRRFPGAGILLAPTRVQGEGADREIATALAALAAHGEVEVILLVRGGGALEDLQAFNTEIVARAVASSPVPVVSGVGHEVDVTLADLSADARAPTPSAAAELALPERESLRARALRDAQRLHRAVARLVERQSLAVAREREALRALAPSARLAARRARLAAGIRALQRAAPEVATRGRARLESAGAALLRGAPLLAERGRARVAAAGGRLDSLSPLAVLGRGYALARRDRDGAILRGADQVETGERISVRLSEAELDARVVSVRPLPRR